MQLGEAVLQTSLDTVEAHEERGCNNRCDRARNETQRRASRLPKSSDEKGESNKAKG
ncbi:MAG: hypothetical protein NVSMB57_06340 [Actinomycetota bacterium]